MGILHLFAIGVDEVRDMFGADPDLAGRLRAVAAERFPTSLGEMRSKQTLLGRIGPLLGRPIDPPHVPAGPSPVDVENLVQGRHVDPSRRPQAWLIVEAWLETLASGDWRVPAGRTDVERIGFDLARAELPSQFGLERLWGRDLSIGLPPAPGMRVGYSKNQHVIETYAAMESRVYAVDQASRQQVAALVEFLGRFVAWDAEEQAAGRSPLDLVGLWWVDADPT